MIPPLRYAGRRERNGTLGSLRFLYDNLCSRGAKDVKDDYTVHLFPAVDRMALGDAFHMTQVRWTCLRYVVVRLLRFEGAKKIHPHPILAAAIVV